jgi:hypothetical protein
VVLTILKLLKDFIHITYHNNDKLFVPIEDFALITKYGNDDISNLDQLGKASWKLRKSKAKKKIEQIAKKLIHIAAQRKMQKGIELNPYLYYDSLTIKDAYLTISFKNIKPHNESIVWDTILLLKKEKVSKVYYLVHPQM